MKERLKTIDPPARFVSRLRLPALEPRPRAPLVPEPAAAKPVDLKDKRKARYQANSAEVQDFYRVNRYPAR